MIIGPVLRAGWKKLGEVGSRADRVTGTETIREGNLFSRVESFATANFEITAHRYIDISSSCSDCASSQVAPRELDRALNRIPITDTRLE